MEGVGILESLNQLRLPEPRVESTDIIFYLVNVQWYSAEV